MRLKKIELQGFKSFADKTEINFEDGITAVVGPNGSGKSNISDALRWVLGEQSAKTLRGTKMGDVIFAGTQNRKPMGFCQVSLYFDNQDKWLNIEYSEVVITRKYYKSGESEYFINRSSCRLKDVLELFRDTGVGKEGYSIIGQGQITNIISNNSNDRRMAFEAATGIVKYKTRKAEAQNRLQKTTDNIERLNDIITEVAASLERLEEQSVKAKEYVEKRDKLKELEINVFANKTVNTNSKISKINDELKLIEEKLNENEKNIDMFLKERAEIENNQEKNNILLDNTKNEYAGFREQAVRNSSDKNLLEQQLLNIKNEIYKDEENISDSKSEKEKNQKLLIDLAKQKDEKKQQLGSINTEHNEAVSKNEELKFLLQSKQKQLDDLKQQKINYLNSISNIKINASRYNTMIETIDERTKSIDAQRENVVNKIKLLEDEIQEVQKQKQSIDLALCEKERQLEQYQNQKNVCKDEISKINQEIHETEVTIGSLSSKLGLLINMQKEYDGFNSSVKNLIKYCKGRNNLIHGTVVDLIKVNKGYTTAIETALGAAVQNIVTENEEDTKKLISILKENKMGRVTFLPISTMKKQQLTEYEMSSIGKIKGVVGVADTLVSYDKKYENVIKKLLGRVVVTKDIDCAIEVMRVNSYKFTTVTVDGEIMHPGGAISGGSKKSVGILSRNDEIDRISKDIKDKEQKRNDLNSKLSQFEKQKSTDSQSILEIQSQIGALEEKLEEVKSIISTIKIQKDNEENNLLELKQEREQLCDNKKDILEKLSLINNSKEINVESVDEDKINILNDEVNNLNEKIGLQYQKTTNLAVLQNDLSKDIISIEKEIKRIEEADLKLDKKIEYCQKNLAGLRERTASIADKLKENSKIIEEISLKEQEYKSNIDNITLESERLSVLKSEKEKLIDSIRKENEINIQRKYQIKSEIDKMQIEMEIISEEIFEKYNLTFKDIDYNSVEKISGASKQIIEIKKAINSLGSVNLNAIDEYASASARYKELTVQMEDLIASKKDLEDLIDMLYKNMTSQFKNQFALINENFKRIFVNLFGGGHAELVLKDANDIMESDIDVIAQPPGKKLQTISLLSGGEKALTAIAILFAMLELKATPFCVLDEIEAALDEANVYNFANYLMNYSNKTQFIVITHRRGVMDNCDAIYGVAMQEKGISKIVSIKLNKGENNGTIQ